MPCYSPLTGYRSRFPTKNGKFAVVWDRAQSIGQEVTIPCGRCIGCRLDRVESWAQRIMLEVKSAPCSCFVTLTYSPECLPLGGTLVPRHLELFWKRLRKAGNRFRYFACGEYGEQFERPHYHAILIGYRPPDLRRPPGSPRGALHFSDLLSGHWGRGFVSVGDATHQSARYCASYVLKRITGDAAADHYQRERPDGCVYSVHPEFVRMSRRPGIGADWWELYASDVTNTDSLVYEGRARRAPRYFDTLRERQDPAGLAAAKAVRKRRAKLNPDNTPERLRARRELAETNQKRKARSYESDSV